MTRTKRRGFRFSTVLAAVCLLTLSAGGCARARAKTMPDAPPLDMPAPPPRDVEPIEAEPLQPMPLPQEPARNAPPRTRPPASPPRSVDAPKTAEPPKPEPIPEIEPPKPLEEPPRPPTTLQTTPVQAEAELERNVRTTLTRASNDLNRIDYRVLDAGARTQYDTAKSFIRQADAAVREKNLVYAKSLADKAAALAAQLGGR